MKEMTWEDYGKMSDEEYEKLHECISAKTVKDLVEQHSLDGDLEYDIPIDEFWRLYDEVMKDREETYEGYYNLCGGTQSDFINDVITEIQERYNEG